MRALLVLAAALLLSGCWIGDMFYGAGDARPAIAPGLYRTADAAGQVSPALFRISSLPDGMTRIEVAEGGMGETLSMGFAPLDREGRAFVAWNGPGGLLNDAPAGFGLLRRGGDGSYVLILPMCGLTVAIAAAAGASPEGPDAVACRFTSRASLETALRSLPADSAALGEVIRLVRAGPPPNP
jgi:hypothetical protein